MADIFNFYVQDDRTIAFHSPEPIMQEDKDVAVWKFRIPKALNQIDMSNWAWWFVYVNAKGQKFSKELMVGPDYDEPGIYNSAEISIDHGISIYPGNFTFALEAIEAVAGGGTIIGEWHTYTYTHKVVGTLQGNQAEYAETQSDIISALIQQIQQKYNALVGGATPQVVSSVSAMTDTSKIYVLSTDGNWYWYNGSAWQSGGQYASGVTIDPTLTEPGQAANAKTVGNLIGGLETASGIEKIQITNVINGRYANTSGGTAPSSNWSVSGYIPIQLDGLIVTIPCSQNSTQLSVMAAVAFFSENVESAFISAVTLKEGIVGTYIKTFVAVPQSAKYMRVSYYTSTESNYSVYGVISQKSCCSIVKNTDDMSATITPFVLVTNNDSAYGTGGACLFKQMDRTLLGYARDNGTRLYPVPDQTAPNYTNAPVAELVHVLSTYVGNSNLTYGQTETLYKSTCNGVIDCSSFVSAILQGITYENSRYVLGSDAQNIIGEFPADALFHYDSAIGWMGYATTNMAQYFAEHKQLFELPNDPVKAVNMLRFGDVLFFSSGNDESGYYGITHCALVIGTIPKYRKIVIAQAGTTPDVTLYDNESTVVKTSMLNIDASNLVSTLRIFARPCYHHTKVQSSEFEPVIALAINGNYEFHDLYFQMNTTINSAGLAPSKIVASTPEFYRVLPSSKLIFTGTYTIDGTIIHRSAEQYDSNFTWLKSDNISPSSALTLNAETRYVRFTYGFNASANRVPNLSLNGLFKVKMYT